MLELKSENTHPIKIEVLPTYVEELSRPLKNDFVFNYFIKIYNIPTSDIQLLAKTLYFRDGKRSETCMEFDDVNEEQAWIPAGDTYEYSEFHTMRTTTGNMRGEIILRLIETDEIIKVKIPLTFFRIFKADEVLKLQKTTQGPRLRE
ncbi:hypothetical protein BIY24_12250 [Halobacteriovorax marinus]|uniref:Co(2+)/Mg(2+) efflux protein ApaG n=1 Tax=Halobacteriovorax marinus TaxID=97084 RepID=UPI000BC2ED65|nr:ApaG domain-containing protein [Halobacteriovorax marinus]ATH08691.1 hypothetical protein BIY24_12250 [Halobacteriovorax marinus]